jgi:hypothetical protein
MALNKLEIIELKIPIIIGQSIGAYSPLLTLFILDKFYKEKDLFESVFKRIIIKKKYIFWYTIAVFYPIVLSIINTFVRYVFGDLSQLLFMKSEPLEILGIGLIIIIPIQFIASLFSSPLGEEPGWRGFIFIELSSKLGKNITSILVGTMWWLWHIPLFITLGESLSFMSYIVILGHSFIIDSLFILSGSNLLVAMLYHQGINTALIFFNPGTETYLGVVVLWINVIIMRIIWLKKSRV